MRVRVEEKKNIYPNGKRKMSVFTIECTIGCSQFAYRYILYVQIQSTNIYLNDVAK